MSTYTLTSLEPSDRPLAGSLSSLVFRIPFPEDALDKFAAQYETLRREHNLEDESHYVSACGRLALEAYLGGELCTERDAWIKRATLAFHELVQENRDTLRHVELILPTGGIATPLNLLSSVKSIAHLETFYVQWPLQGYAPLTLMLMPDWAHILDGSIIIAAFATFHDDLMAVLATHAPTLTRLRISLPQSTPQRPFSALSLTPRAFPVLPVLELLDLTHWGPTAAHLRALLALLPALLHLILDQGTEISATEDDDGDCENWANNNATPGPEDAGSWPALGAVLATHPLRTLSAALHEMRAGSRLLPVRLRRDALCELLASGSGAGRVPAVCTAWPVAYIATEPGAPAEGSAQAARDADMYVHTPGCGHFAYPPELRPTTGLWPAQRGEQSALAMLAGGPWY
ncbi:hypothetical protein B0H15DRAFT_244690 [Mycena belliarum]|uniref:Uncharacterized protein n=1 Tax=Mycena belliarum TaxID=1033014 RepID=A0AAD6XPZ6_9AGAR|nr:hypothetical protein B0H15DRAFT_244690 [Mycena belliae]